jgi:cation transport regulator ChaB
MSTGTLPKSAKATWEKIYNSALKGSCNGDKSCAASVAWSAIKKQGWRKKDGKWMKKSDPFAEFSMFITKASTDGKFMRWAATNSDTDWDSYEERMSQELYLDFIARINSKEPVPEIFRSTVCSSYWCGGMPYLSISHYPDLDGTGVPGEPIEIFVDGNRLKAKGILYNTPLGNSVFRSLREDKNKHPENKIRISIGFLDLAHKHGDEGKLWVRDGLMSICPECLEGAEYKVYVKGHLVHLALTRVPVNKRTEMVLE